MSPGRQHSPRCRLHADLRAAVRLSMLLGRGAATLGPLCSFPNINVFSYQLHRSVPQTPLNVSRWRRVAECLNYTGPLFDESEPAVRLTSELHAGATS